MQLLHFTQIALYAFLKMYLLGKMWVVDKLLCSHNEIRSKEAGPHFIYLIFYGLLFSLYFSCGWCDDLVGDIWQTVLDALKLVVMCICVGLRGSGLCKRGSRSISFRRRFHASEMTQIAGFYEMERDPYHPVCINLLNRHIGGGHFVWQPQEEQDT